MIGNANANNTCFISEPGATDVFGDDAFLDGLVEFYRERPQDGQILDAALTSGNLDEALRLVRDLPDDFASLCRRVEEAAREELEDIVDCYLRFVGVAVERAAQLRVDGAPKGGSDRFRSPA